MNEHENTALSLPYTTHHYHHYPILPITTLQRVGVHRVVVGSDGVYRKIQRGYANAENASLVLRPFTATIRGALHESRARKSGSSLPIIKCRLLPVLATLSAVAPWT